MLKIAMSMSMRMMFSVRSDIVFSKKVLDVAIAKRHGHKDEDDCERPKEAFFLQVLGDSEEVAESDEDS